jgi:hypothetical protein
MPWETPKTNWTPSDPVGAGDMNRIEGNAAQLKSDLDAHTQATTGVHGATSTATPNTIVQRDPAGRFKAAAPSASDDVARKDTVDNAISSHVGAADPHTQYLLKTAYTAADVLAKLKTVDGAGSGLDADTVRGYIPANKAGDIFTGNINIQKGGDTGIDFGTNPQVAGAIGVFPGWSGRLYINMYSASGARNVTRPAGVEIGGPVYVDGGQEVWHRGDLRWNTAGYLEYNDGGTWKAVGYNPWSMTANVSVGSFSSSINNGSTANLFTVTGKGILTSFQCYVGGSQFGVELVVDGVVKSYLIAESGSSKQPTFAGYVFYTSSSSSTTASIIHLPVEVPFNSSLVARIRNVGTTSANPAAIYNATYLLA